MSAPTRFRHPAGPGGARVDGRRLIRWVLACFALSLGIAVASPIVHRQAFELVCSGAGAGAAGKWIVPGADGSRDVGVSHLDCPLCLPLGAAVPPTAALLPAAPPRPAAALPQVPSVVLAVAGAWPPPGRGPPATA